MNGLNPATLLRAAGFDLGKSSAKLVVVRSTPKGVEVDRSELVEHGGEPLEAFRQLCVRANFGAWESLGVTGLYGDQIAAPAMAGLPEAACLESGLELFPHLPKSLNLLSIGARGYSALSRNEFGQVRQLENDKCSSGTGETMVKAAARFGLSI